MKWKRCHQTATAPRQTPSVSLAFSGIMLEKRKLTTILQAITDFSLTVIGDRSHRFVGCTNMRLRRDDKVKDEAHKDTVPLVYMPRLSCRSAGFRKGPCIDLRSSTPSCVNGPLLPVGPNALARNENEGFIDGCCSSGQLHDFWSLTAIRCRIYCRDGGSPCSRRLLSCHNLAHHNRVPAVLFLHCL